MAIKVKFRKTADDSRDQAHSALSSIQRAAYWLFVAIGVSLVVIFGAWWFAPIHVPANFHGVQHILDYLLFGLLSYIVWHQILMDLLLWSVSAKVKKLPKPEPPSGLHVAFITTFVPGKEPAGMLERTVQAMVDADYPHYTWVLDEGDDPEAREICKRLGARHFTRNGISEFNTASGPFAARTKGGNHNAWYHSIGYLYDFVAHIDMDFVPQKNFLTSTLGYFNDHTIAFVGTPQVYGNLNESLVAKGAAQQTYGFYGPILRGFSGHSSTMLIGANHVVRVSALRDIGFYQAHVTEDLLTGMTFHSNKWRSVYVPEILAVGEGPATWKAYLIQQMRWSFGCIDILYKHSRRIFKKMDRSQAVHYFVLQQHYFNGLALAVGNMLLLLYFLFGINASSIQLWPLAMVYVPLLVWQLFFATWLQRLNVDPKTERGFLWQGRFVSIAAWPIYFLAAVSVVRGKRMPFHVTPKGSQEHSDYPMSIFVPHFVIGSVTAAGIAVSFLTHHQAGVMIFWAALNSILMYSVIASGLLQRYKRRPNDLDIALEQISQSVHTLDLRLYK